MRKIWATVLSITILGAAALAGYAEYYFAYSSGYSSGRSDGYSQGLNIGMREVYIQPGTIIQLGPGANFTLNLDFSSPPESGNFSTFLYYQFTAAPKNTVQLILDIEGNNVYSTGYVNASSHDGSFVLQGRCCYSSFIIIRANPSNQGYAGIFWNSDLMVTFQSS